MSTFKEIFRLIMGFSEQFSVFLQMSRRNRNQRRVSSARARKCHRLLQMASYQVLLKNGSHMRWITYKTVEVKNHEVDRYWSEILDRKNALSQPKYCTLGKVVRAALALSH